MSKKDEQAKTASNTSPNKKSLSNARHKALVGSGGTSRQLLGIIVLLLFIIAALAIVILVLLIQMRVADETTLSAQGVEERLEIEPEITAEDGGKFNLEYELGSNKDFIMRFPNLACDETCTNINSLKVNEKPLVAGADYLIKKGSVIIILLSGTMESLGTGEHQLTFEISMNNQQIIASANFMIKDDIPTCENNQVLDNGKCVDKKNEQPASSSPSNNSTQNQAAGSTPTVCRYNYASQAIGIEPASGTALARWDTLTVNAFNQIKAYDRWVSPRQPENLGIDMGDVGGVYYFGGGWTGNKSGWTFTADPATLTIGYAVDTEVYGSDGHYVTLNNAARYQLDEVTTKMTSYLRELDTKFKTKCSSFVSTL